jgi:TPR repeat protein
MDAAKRGVLEAQFSVGVCFSRGEGIRRDPGLAFRWYLAAARRGHPDAAHNLALYYEKGNGTRRNERKAQYWRERSKVE